MGNLLYVTCNVSPQHQSRTLSLGNDFLEEYLRLNPHDAVEVLDLYRDSIQRADQDVLNARARIERGEEYGLLSEQERWKMSRLWRLADQFGRCDKYVFVTHSLNLWFPAEFKMYVDAVLVPDRTYCVTRLGAEGMLPRRPRKSLHLHAGPPFAFGRENDLSAGYLRSVLNFLGIAEQEMVFLRGDDPELGNHAADEAARLRLLELARSF